ncbi:MAG: serine/threonine-protein kinase [Planctomycetota bacterium]|nr:serine/threonine-protein kinase [Planctomycetota bacterium]
MSISVKQQPQRGTAGADFKVGNWERVAEIGRGRWFVAYRARPRHFSAAGPADYVVKVPIEKDVSETALQMLRREATVSQEFSHPHVQTVLEAGFSRSLSYVVLPYFPGATWGDLVGVSTWRLASRCLWVFRQVAEGLQALHEAGWVHGDLTPGNVYVATTGHTLLIDLGMSIRRSVAGEQSRKVFMGTLNYAAPETFVAGRVVDASSDIYGLGVLLYEALTGRLPFVLADSSCLPKAHRCTRPLPLERLMPELPSNLIAMVTRMLAKEPCRRPRAEEIVSEMIELEVAMFAQTLRLPAPNEAQRVA